MARVLNLYSLLLSHHQPLDRVYKTNIDAEENFGLQQGAWIGYGLAPTFHTCIARRYRE